jgi:5-methylcytosine-specific restriction enzyme subunit McrC
VSTLVLSLDEGDPPRRLSLTAGQARALAISDALSVAPTGVDGEWMVAPGTRVGAFQVRCGGAAGAGGTGGAGATAGGQTDTIQVRISPKIPIARLVLLMGYARNPLSWRDDLVSLEEDADLPEALSHTLAVLAARALDQGVLKGYVTVDESLPVLRGRLREADQIRRFGVGLPLEVRFDDYSVDIAENRILLAAVLRALRMPGVSAQTRTLLRRLRLQLADVTLIAGPRPTWTRTRLNARYEPALVVAEMILDCRSFELRVGDLVVSGFLLNMAKIFEDFVCVALGRALGRLPAIRSGRASLQYRTHLDAERMVPIRPDFVWSRGGRPVAVADAKYKAERPSGFPQADLYQMLAYCTVLGLDTGHLVYAKGEEAAGVVDISGSPVRVVRHVLDLEAAQAQMLRQIATIAQGMADGLVGRAF